MTAIPMYAVWEKITCLLKVRDKQAIMEEYMELIKVEI
jgi:hypothetical protein